MKLKCTNPKCRLPDREFEASRADAKFCSPSCKQCSHRAFEKQAELSPAEKIQKSLDDGDEMYRENARRLAEAHTIDPTIPDTVVLEWEAEAVAGSKERTKKHLTTGRATPGLNYPGWSRPKYWLRLRDLPEGEQGPFHNFLKGRNNPVDPTLPTEEQDFYHPWAYTEFKNPEEAESKPVGQPMVPMTIPKWETPEQIKVRLGRIRDYNSTMEPRHHLSESKLRAILKKGGYDPNLARQVFSKSKPSTSIPE